jgi:pyridoxal phosphate enzyme (YggS family)
MTLTERLGRVRDRVARAAEESGREAEAVTLVTVSKTHPAEVVSEAVAAGALNLGENRVQEAHRKKASVLGGATWHLIGPLQRNKVRDALATFDIVHTLDRPELADRLELVLERDWPGRVLPVLLEVNVGNEPQKAGATPDEAADLLRHAVGQTRLDVRGLMAIPPWSEDPEATRPHFVALRRLRDDLEQVVGRRLPELSMGMSHDFEVAVAEGATIVRVGTAIFGPRRSRP